MKKLFFCLYLLLMISPCAMAANQFSNPPNSINYYYNEKYSSYLDISSIESLRKEPPYYEVQAGIYSIDFMSDSKIHSIIRYFYDVKMKTVKIQIVQVDICDTDWHIIKQSACIPQIETFSDDAIFWGADIVFDHAY